MVIDEISGKRESEVSTSRVSAEHDVFLLEAEINEVRVPCQGVEESRGERMNTLLADRKETVLDREGSGDGRTILEESLRDGSQGTVRMPGSTDVPSTMGVVDDLLAWLRWLFGFQAEILVHPVTWNLDGRDVESLCPRLDFTDDQVVGERRYPDSMRTRELWWINSGMA